MLNAVKDPPLAGGYYGYDGYDWFYLGGANYAIPGRYPFEPLRGQHSSAALTLGPGFSL